MYICNTLHNIQWQAEACPNILQAFFMLVCKALQYNTYYGCHPRVEKLMLSLPLDRCKVTGQGSRFLLAYNAIKTLYIHGRFSISKQ